ncbi:MAG: hypothetical protein K9N35_09835 [Candidatus Marinimicrobia bacterium]|nr:hypothetical protein [Candidatus Neomarinimicrobiota bacterium]
MKTLLVYALNPEAGLIKDRFSKLDIKLSQPGMELLEADGKYDLLRTGIGLERTRAVTRSLPDPRNYEQVIHFGVSGSLSDELPVRTLIKGRCFMAKGEDPIEIESPLFSNVSSITFYSSQEVVSDEGSREEASSSGAKAVDMESYAIAEFCRDHDLPLLSLRIISDRAGASTPDEFRKNFKSASRELQKHIINYLF